MGVVQALKYGANQEGFVQALKYEADQDGLVQALKYGANQVGVVQALESEGLRPCMKRNFSKISPRRISFENWLFNRNPSPNF